MKHRIGRVLCCCALESSIHQHIDMILVFLPLLEGDLSLFEVDKLAARFEVYYQLIHFDVFFKFCLLQQFYYDILANDVFETVAQTSFNILATH